MSTQILGLPLHPLAVHVPIVLVPLFALLVIVYTCVPRVRKHCSWLLCGLAIATPLGVVMAALSGDPLAMQKLPNGRDGSAVAQSISAHATYGGLLMWITILLGLITLLFLFLVRRTRLAAAQEEQEPKSPKRKRRNIGQVVLAGFAVLLSAVAMFLVVNAGHSGASMVWSP